MSDNYDEWVARSKDLFTTCQQLADECRRLQREYASERNNKEFYYKRYIECDAELTNLKAKLHNQGGKA